MPTDTERLDWLAEQGNQSLYGWVARRRTQIDGYALHQTRRMPSFATPREAIDAAMQAEAEEEGREE